MNQFIKLCCLIFIFSALTIQTSFAQKMGHINSGNLLELLPETKVAAKELEKFQKDLTDAYDAKIKAFEEKVKKHLNPERRKTISPIALQNEQNALAKEEQTLLKERQANDQKVMEKRQELLKPIFERVDEAIKQVAQEQGFKMIFDSSVFNVILYKEDSEDITEFVKTKLGLKKD